MNPTIVSFVYLFAGILFILGIKGLTKPRLLCVAIDYQPWEC